MIIDQMNLNRRTLDKGYITFDNRIKAEKWNDILVKRSVPFVRYVTIADGRIYYAFKMFYIKKEIFRLYMDLEEVISL